MRANDQSEVGKQKRRRERHTLYLLNIIGLCILTLMSIAGTVTMFLRARTLESNLEEVQTKLDAIEGEEKTLYTTGELMEEVAEAKEDARRSERSSILMQIQSSLESGNSTTSMLRGLFADDIVVVSGGKYYFYPVIKSLATQTFNKGDFEFDDAGFLQYVGSDEAVQTENGISISQDNGEIDWELVAESGITFVIIRAGGRGSDGELFEDENFVSSMEGAKECGLKIGAYFVSAATDSEEAVEEATYFKDLLSDYRDEITMPATVVIPTLSGTGRMAEVTKSDNTDYLAAFCEVIKAAQFEPQIYGNLASMVMDTDLSKLEDYNKWVQDYSNNIYFPYRFSMWQYSSTGQIQGIEGDVSLSLLVTTENSEGQ